MRMPLIRWACAATAPLLDLSPRCAPVIAARRTVSRLRHVSKVAVRYGLVTNGALGVVAACWSLGLPVGDAGELVTDALGEQDVGAPANAGEGGEPDLPSGRSCRARFVSPTTPTMARAGQARSRRLWLRTAATVSGPKNSTATAVRRG